MGKNVKYIIAIGVLLIANLGLWFVEDDASASFDDTLFALTGEMVRVSITGEESIELENVGDKWLLNDSLEADASFIRLLSSIMSQIRVGRRVSNPDLQAEGSVHIQIQEGTPLAFSFATNATKTKTYFFRGGQAYEVSVPGYQDNVGDIFTLHPDQWQSREVLDASWRTIQRLKILDLEKDESTMISFDDDFFLINSQPVQDSSAVVDYLNQFQLFQANEVISKGRSSRLDSLSKTPPIAKVTFETIHLDHPYSWAIFPSLRDQTYHLVIDSNHRWMVIDQQRMEAILSYPK